MLHTITFLLISLFMIDAPAQSIVDIYKLLPDKYTPGTRQTTEEMIRNYQLGVHGNTPYWFDIVDEKNGFLSLGGPLQYIWEMRSWNLGQNKKLVAVYSHECEPVCYVNEFRFFKYENKTLREIDKSKVIRNYEDMYDDFFVSDPKTSKAIMKEEETIATLLFKLPQTGKDIIAFFGNEGPDKTYEKVSKGNRMLLRWHNGTFIKSKIYWDNLSFQNYFPLQSASQ